MKSTLCDLQVEFQTQTPTAVGIREHEGARDTWIPKSQCQLDQGAPLRGTLVTLTAPKAVLIDKGLV